MDEDDSQDELINRSTSHSRGKRAALWAISDDSDDSEEEGESDSEEEEQDGHINGDDEEEDEGNEEEDDEEDEEDAQPEDGGFEGSSADLAIISSDEDADKCPICLNTLNSQPVATPENCEHYFCFDCILEWAKNANSCPVDRIAFNSIYLRKCYGGKVKKMITVQKPVKAGQEETVDLDLEQTSCEVCGGSDREDRLLLCDGCDAGYHMECLTPPLDSVPVEEWFCPECEANNRNSRGSAEELSDADSLPSTARPATSRSRAHVAGPTRAIARTQQSERVRANVNRHRITQARTSQLAPTYLMQSTWLDETINAVVAGLNTAVHIRDLTPRVPSSRKRKTRKRRKVGKSRKTSSAKNGKVPSTGVKRRRRKARRTKSRKKMMAKNVATPRSRIANSLRIVKDKKSSSLPTVYRPSEHTLSSMRADIGAASLSIYGDAFDLDPFVDCEEDEQQAHVSSLLEAKRRGISCSALRSHQPVARPVTASLSRRGMDVHQPGGVVEAAPVPDLLGSILSGQSILLMDSSDVVINRDGSLKATKPMMPSVLMPDSSKSSSSGDANNPGIPANLGDSSESQPGPSRTSMSTPLSQSSSRLPPLTASSTNHTQTPLHPDLRVHPDLHPPRPNRRTPSSNQRGSNGFGASRESISVCTTPESSDRSKGIIPSQSQSKTAPTKPMWVDVSELPRIPKIKRESSGMTNNGTRQGGSHKGSSRRGHRSNSTRNGNDYGTPETGMNNLSGDKGRQQSVDQQKGQADGQAQRHRPDGGNSSSTFSNSFSSSSSTGCPASQPRYASSSSSSSSSSVSFRINSSGNPWQSRRLGIAASSSSGSTFQEHWRKKDDEARKRQLDRDKQMLLASRSVSSKEQDNIYDPFNPTLSDSSSSGDEVEDTSLESSSQHVTLERKSPSLSSETTTQNKQVLVQVKTETPEIEISQEEPGRAQKTTSDVRLSEDSVRVEKESRLTGIKTEKQTVLLDIKVKKEPCEDTDESEICVDKLKSSLNSETLDTTPPTHPTLDLFKAERETQGEKSGQCAGTPNRSLPKDKEDSSAMNSATVKRKQKEETKSHVKSFSKSPPRDLDHKKRSSKALKDQPSSGSETDRGRRGDHHTSGKGGKQKERDWEEKERGSRRSRSRERRRAHSSSDSSQPRSPDRTHRKRQRSQSRSKDETRRRRSRSASSSSSREHSQRKKHKRRSKERNDDKERDHDRRRVSKDKRHGRSHSKSQSKSRSRSRTRSKSRDRKHGQSESRSRSRERKREHNKHSSLSSRDKVDSRSKEKRRPRSRSSSRERRKEERTSKSSHQTLGPSLPSSRGTKQLQDKKKEKDVTQSYTKDKKVEVKVKEGSSCSFTSKIKKEDKVLGAESQSTITDMTKETKVTKEIKEKRASLDMFEDVPFSTPVKKEETDTSLSVSENLDFEGPIKTESCEIPIVKSEPGSICSAPPDTSFPTLTAPVAADSHQKTVSQSQPVLVAKHQNTELAIPVKLEVQQPSDSDDDFNIDVMLDSLDYVKSEHTEGSDAAVKQEKEVVEGKIEAEQASMIAGAKSKTQVKRVTWNIQEPEGHQPEKSASKLALYKLKLKQEGARRPSLTVQASSQDITADDIDPSKKGADGLLSTSKSDGLHPGELSAAGQGEAEEGDVSRKDKYLKKLHMQERAIEEVKLAIKPFYQRRDINKDEYKEILRKAVQKVCHSKSGEINPVKVGNLVKAYVDKYKHARKHKKGEDVGKAPDVQTEAVKTSDSPQ